MKNAEVMHARNFSTISRSAVVYVFQLSQENDLEEKIPSWAAEPKKKCTIFFIRNPWDIYTWGQIFIELLIRSSHSLLPIVRAANHCNHFTVHVLRIVDTLTQLLSDPPLECIFLLHRRRHLILPSTYWRAFLNRLLKVSITFTLQKLLFFLFYKIQILYFLYFLLDCNWGSPLFFEKIWRTYYGFLKHAV